MKAFHSQPPQPHRRQGVSLTEVIVVITLSSFVVGLAGILIQQMLRIDRSLARGALAAAQLNRLESLFRQDVWSATESSLIPTEQGLRLTLPQGDDRRVVYETAGPVLRRQVVARDRETHRDRFAFGPESRVFLTDDRAGPRIVLTVEASTMPVDQGAIPGFGPGRRRYRMVATPSRTTAPLPTPPEVP